MSRTSGFPDRLGSKVNRADTSLTEIHRLRLRGIKAGTWPRWCDDEWHARAAQAVASGDVSGPAVRAIETSRALREADAKAKGQAA